MSKISLKEIIENTDADALKSWILEYAENNDGFEQLLREKFSPELVGEDDVKDYPFLIRQAFSSNSLRVNDWHRGYNEYGFDAYAVRYNLEEILSDADYFLRNGNTKVAAQICKNMIEIIPEEWEDQFDHDGDVQVMYDEAIDKLEMMLKEQLLPENEKEDLFEWYIGESKNTSKHRHIGINTNLAVLHQYFVSTNEMIAKNLQLLDKKIQSNIEDYYKESYVLDKINILQKVSRIDEMQRAIDTFLKFEKVRRIRLESLLRKNDYSQAIILIQEGIKIAEVQRHAGTVSDWKDELLKIYQIQNDTAKILKLAEDLLYNGREQEKYYYILKQYIPQGNWPEAVKKMLQNLKSTVGVWGFNRFRAKVLIESEKWEELFEQCETGGVEYVEEYEKYFRPQYDEDLYRIYLNYAELQATVTDQEAYSNVGRMLTRLKTFENGKAKVDELITKYRIQYKRRKNMMKVLDEVEGV